MQPQRIDAGDSQVVAFIDAIKTAIGDEPFDEMERFLERAWVESRMPGDPEWPEVRDRMREEWARPARPRVDPAHR